MATRGTYQFTSSIDENIKTFYIHHDNYVEGAKEKLQNCSSVSFFMIKNPEAEPIKSHDDYSDTEYRYDVHFTPKKMGFRKGKSVGSKFTIEVKKRIFNYQESGKDKWFTIFSGTDLDFNYWVENRLNLGTC